MRLSVPFIIILLKINSLYCPWNKGFIYSHAYMLVCKIVTGYHYSYVNGRDDVSNHQPHDYLLNRLFRHRLLAFV